MPKTGTYPREVSHLFFLLCDAVAPPTAGGAGGKEPALRGSATIHVSQGWPVRCHFYQPHPTLFVNTALLGY